MTPESILTPLQITFLAFIQGATEFLPISSSAHLILPSALFGWPDQGLTFDVAVHLGSLLAVLWYFRLQVSELLLAWLGAVSGRRPHSDSSRLAWLLILATIPAGMAGILLEQYVESYARSAFVIGVASIGFGMLLWLADRRAQTAAKPPKELSGIGWRQALIVGLAQALALIPGTSRSGITMTAALYCGLGREAAANLSFLMAIPIIAATGLLRGVELLSADVATVDLAVLLYATLLSALVAYLCIHFFLRFIAHVGFLPFVIYRVLLGAVLLLFFW